MSKIVRRGSRLYTYVIENDNDPSTLSTMRIYMKEGEGAWQAGAGFPSSRPGNILMDSAGALHAFVFEATDVLANDSIGKLRHYTLANASNGDITTNLQELVVDHTSGNETVNIRVGAAISSNNLMLIAFGLTTIPLGQTEQVYTKLTSDPTWTQQEAGINLLHDFYYPFARVKSNGDLAVLPIQDDFTGMGNPNIYQIIRLFTYSSSTWNNELIVDLTSHALAASRPKLLEQSDLYIDSSGNTHIIYKEFLHPTEQSTASAFKHLVGSSNNWTTKTLDLSALGINWLRMLEINGIRYFVGSSFQNLYIFNEEGTSSLEVPIPADISGIYPYIAGPEGGTLSSETSIDVLILNGNSSSYPSGSSYHVKIEKSEFSRL